MNFDINTAMILGAQLASLGGVIITVFFARKTVIASEKTQENTDIIKVHTNSMTEKLVSAEQKLAGLEAVAREREDQAKSAAERAKGVLQGQLTKEVEDVVKENGKANGHPTNVNVVNTDKPVPVKVTEGDVSKIAAAVKKKTKPRAAAPRKRKVKK